jgi:hypothetical protein
MAWRRLRGALDKPLVREGVLVVLSGLFMASVGAFSTDDPSIAKRTIYWVGVMLAGGAVAVALERVLERGTPDRIPGRWTRVAAVTALMTTPVAVIVWLASWAVWDAPLSGRRLLGLLPAVLLVCLVLNALRHLTRSRPADPAPAPEPQTEAPAEAPGAAFRRRLSARARSAPLYAVEAHDHYLRIHTGAGTELVLMRFGDALAELDGAGFQTHRSWWVARDAIAGVNWSRGRGEVRLVDGGAAPVSRSFAPVLREHGWF